MLAELEKKIGEDTHGKKGKDAEDSAVVMKSQNISACHPQKDEKGGKINLGKKGEDGTKIGSHSSLDPLLVF